MSREFISMLILYDIPDGLHHSLKCVADSLKCALPQERDTGELANLAAKVKSSIQLSLSLFLSPPDALLHRKSNLDNHSSHNGSFLTVARGVLWSSD